MNVEPGDEAPDFTLPDANGQEWRLSDHRGQTVVLYFYPRDDTPGCTDQACDVRDHWSEFASLNVEVVGISPDDSASHAAFAARHELPHTLLADTERTVLQRYGAWGKKSMYGREYEGVIRSSVVIGPDGVVAAVFDKIKPKDQSRKALEAVKALLPS